MTGANHQMRTLDQHKIDEKHQTSPSPHSLVQAETSDQSNWHSSPGPVSIRVDANGAPWNPAPDRIQVTGDAGIRPAVALGHQHLEDTGAE